MVRYNPPNFRTSSCCYFMDTTRFLITANRNYNYCGWYVIFNESMTHYTLDNTLTFGLHKGLTIREILNLHPDYIRWVFENIEWIDLNYEVIEYMDRKINPFYDDDRWIIGLLV